MFVRRWISLLSVLALLLFPAAVCRAEGNVVLFQAYAWDKNIDMYIAGEINPESLACKGANQTLEIVDSGLLADRGVTVRTTLLLDVSASMPKNMRDSVQIYIDKLIENISENEQYKIVTFDEELTVLQDFTNDRYDLAKAIDGIAFDGQESKIYDAVYNTMPEKEPVDSEPCYYRTVVITDGIDDTASGVTKEELYLKLQTDTYPVEVVAVSEAEQGEAEKELAALTRISGGRYANLYAEAEPEAVAAALGTDGIYWVRASLPDTLLDGSLRPFVLTDENVTLQFDVRVPALELAAGAGDEAPDGETDAADPEGSAVSEAVPKTAGDDGNTGGGTPGEVPGEAESAGSGTPEDSEKSAAAADFPGEAGIGGAVKELTEKYSFAVFIAAGGGIVLIIVVAVVLVTGQSRKKKNSSANGPENKPVRGPVQPSGGGDTEILSGNSSGAIKDDMMYIKIRDTSQPEQSWNVSLADTVVVGRETVCQVCIADNSVSREQCIIYLVSNIPTIENKSKSNITRLNGEQLSVPRPLREGDKIKCGRVTLIVDCVYRGTGNGGGNLNKDTRFVNV